MKWGPLLRVIGTLAASVGAGDAVSPAVGVALGATIGGSALAHRGLKRLNVRLAREGRPPLRLQKLGTPATAALIPLLLQQAGLDLAPICSALQWLAEAVCREPAVAGATLGGLAVMANTLGRQVEETFVPPAAIPPAGGT